MASPDNYLTSLEPWFFNSIFPTDPWLSDTFSREADVITKALTRSISDDTITTDYTTFPTNTNSNSDMFFSTSSSSSPADDDGLSVILRTITKPSYYHPESSPNLNQHETTHHQPTPATVPSQSISVSGSAGSGSDPESATEASKRIRTTATGPAPKIKGIAKKRKSRVSKKSATTFIAADAANFRQMVQQVTGVNFSSTPSGGSGSLVLRPEPLRIAGMVQSSSLPTLDTSAFLLDHHHRQQSAAARENTPVVNAATAGTRKNSTRMSGGVGSGASGFDFDSYAACFPTLESWKVM